MSGNLREIHFIFYTSRFVWGLYAKGIISKKIGEDNFWNVPDSVRHENELPSVVIFGRVYTPEECFFIAQQSLAELQDSVFWEDVTNQKK